MKSRNVYIIAGPNGSGKTIVSDIELFEKIKKLAR